MSLIHPGDVSDSEPLSGILRRIHDDNRAATLAEIRRREASGTPLNDNTRWASVKDKVQGILVGVDKQDTRRVRKLAVGILEATASFLEDPGEFIENPRTKDVVVRLVVLSARRVRALSGIEHRALEAQHKARAAIAAHELAHANGAEVTADEEELHVALEVAGERVIGARRALVAESLKAIAVGNQEEHAPTEADLDALERTGLLLSVYTACAAFQDLPWGKDGLSGSPAPSTSESSTAPNAPAPRESTGGASAGA